MVEVLQKTKKILFKILSIKQLIKFNINKNKILIILLFTSIAFLNFKSFPLYPDLNRPNFFFPCLILGILNYIAFCEKWYLVLINSLLGSIAGIIISSIFNNLKLDISLVRFTILSWIIVQFIVYIITFFINGNYKEKQLY